MAKKAISTARQNTRRAEQAKRAPSTDRIHSKTRSDHSNEIAEDYVEAILVMCQAHGRCRAIDLARKFSVSQVTVNRTIGRLVRDGLVLTEPYGPLELTEAGKRLAEEAKNRHTIVYNLLIAIGVDSETAAIDSEGMEHHASPTTLTAIQKFLKAVPGSR